MPEPTASGAPKPAPKDDSATDTVQVSGTVSADVADKLDAFTRATGLTRGWLVAKLVTEGAERLVDPATLSFTKD